MRPYTNKDHKYLKESLLDAGFTENQMTFETDLTYITDTGFFSYRIEHNYPRLIHFYIDKEKRSFKEAQKMIREFINILRDKDYLFFIAEAPKELPYMKRLIKYIKGKKYLEQDGDTYFYVPIFGRVK